VDDVVCHLRVIAERRKAADKLRAQLQQAMQEPRDYEAIMQLSERIEEIGQ
jgi:hypothetical protein